MGRKRNVDKTIMPEDPEALRYAVGYGNKGTVLVKFNHMIGTDLALDHESARVLGQNLIRAARLAGNAAAKRAAAVARSPEPGHAAVPPQDGEEILQELSTHGDIEREG